MLPCINFLLSGGRDPECVDTMGGLLVTEEEDLISPTKGLVVANIYSLMSWFKTNREARKFGLKNHSAKNVVAYDCISKSIIFKNGDYQLPLLWKNVSVKFPNSIDMATWRLESVKRRLEREVMLKMK